MCVSRLRRRSRRPTAEFSDVHAAPSAESDPVLMAERRERAEAIQRAIGCLSPQHREVIVLNHFQGLSYKEIAATVGIPMGTVMSRLHNARLALRKVIEEGGA